MCVPYVMDVSVHTGPLLSKSVSWDDVRAQRTANPNEDILKALTHPKRGGIIG